MNNEELTNNESENSSEENSSEETSENENTENEETSASVVYIENSVDYSGYFENLQTIGIFICGLLVAYGIAFAFFKGFKK